MTHAQQDNPTPQPQGGQPPLLSVHDLRVHLPSRHDGPGHDGAPAEVVRGVSMEVAAGETLAMVGESGSGKTVTALALMGLLPAGGQVTADAMTFDGQQLTAPATARQWQHIRGEQIAMVFQDPLSSLNPCYTVGTQIAEMFRRHRKASRKDARRHALALMEDVGIPDARRRLDAYPHEFSGGMRQRIMIAMAVALDPRLLIADEPTTALDVTVQAQIFRLLEARRQRSGMAMILVSHDLGVVARSADSVAVMYAGRIVEQGPIPTVYTAPAHPYTLGLMSSAPQPREPGSSPEPAEQPTRLPTIEGQPPLAGQLPSGCAFHPRCPFATPICRERAPDLVPVGPHHRSACHHAADVLALSTADQQPADPAPDQAPEERSGPAPTASHTSKRNVR